MRAVPLLTLGALTSATLLFATPARAIGVIVSAPDGASRVAGVHVALAATATRTTRWVSLDVHGSASAIAWILPVAPTAYVDATSDAWFEALEDASAPRVVAPSFPAACAVDTTVDDEAEPPPSVTVPSSSAAVATDAPTLSAALAGWGMTLPGQVASAVTTAAAQGDEFVALYFPQAAAHVRTRTVRVVDASASTLALGWLPAGAPVDVTAYTLLAGAATLPKGASFFVDPSTVLWKDGGSTYGAVTSAELLSYPDVWLVETRARGPVFQTTPLPDGTSIAPLAGAYFARAAKDGDATRAPSACTATAQGWATSTATVAAACPAGALAHVGADTCAETTPVGQISADAFRCGGVSDDLALALSAISPSSAWITRMRTAVSAGVDTTVVSSATATPSGPVVPSAGYVAGICAAAQDAGEPPTSSHADAGGELDAAPEKQSPAITGTIGSPSSSGCDGSCQGVGIIEMSVAGRRQTRAASTVSLVLASLALARRRRRRSSPESLR